MQPQTEPILHAAWPAWVDFLHRHNLENLATWFLEAAGPFGILGGQALIFGAPLLRSVFPKDQLDAFTHLLEEPDEGQAFINYLHQKRTA